MSTIAVTGASGFIGRHVLANLASHSVEVVAISRHQQHAESGKTIRWVAVDIMNPPRDLFDAIGKPDVLLHLAWDDLSNYRDTRHLDEYLPAHEQFLENMVRGGLKRLIAVGTCLEYGMKTGCLSEKAGCDPVLAYPQAKLGLLRSLQQMETQYQFDLTWARLFYMFGDGQSTRSLWPLFMAAYRRGEDSFDMSGGKQMRDFLPVEEVARYLGQLAISKRKGGVINICSGQPVSVRSLVESWADKLGWKVKLNLGAYPYPDYEPMEFWGDNSRLKEVLAAP